MDYKGLLNIYLTIEGFEKPGLLVIPNAFGKRNFKTAAY